MKFWILLTAFLLSGCARSENNIGSVESRLDWECLKSDIDLGISSNGDLVAIPTCKVTKCIETKVKLAKYSWKDEVLDKKIVEDERCL